MKTKSIGIGALACVLAVSMSAFGLSACSGNSTSNSTTNATSGASTKVSPTGVDHSSLDISKIGTDNYAIKLGLTKNNPNPVAIINALQSGLFEKQGANVDLKIVESMGTAYSSVGTNQLDMVAAMNLSLNRIAEGEENMYMVGGIMSEGGVCFVKADSPIELKTADDFKGLTICGIQADSELIVIEAWLLNNGLERDKDYKVIYTDSMAVNIENVNKGVADVGILNGVPVYMIGVKSGNKIAAYNADLVGEYPCCRITVNKDMVTEHKYALANFLVAELQGYRMFLEDKEQTVKNLADFTGVDPVSLESVYYGTPEFRTAMEIVMDPQVDYIKDYYEDYKTCGFIDPETPYALDEYFYNEAYLGALDYLINKEPDVALWKDLKSKYTEANKTYTY